MVATGSFEGSVGAAMAKSWTQKMDGRDAPAVQVLDRAYGGAPAGGMMLVATPRLVERYIRSIPAGESRTIAEMRADLAREHGAAITCPMSTSIFVRIVAEAALEAREAGVEDAEMTPFWRIVEPASPLAAKLSCGREYVEIKRKLERGSPA